MAIRRVTPAEKRALRLNTALCYANGKFGLKDAAEIIGVDSKNASAYLGTSLLRAARDGEVVVRRKRT